MLCGRQQEMRKHALSQAALVWSIAELGTDGIEAFIQYGEIHTKKESPMPYMPEVEAKVAEIYANGGKLII